MANHTAKELASGLIGYMRMTHLCYVINNADLSSMADILARVVVADKVKDIINHTQTSHIVYTRNIVCHQSLSTPYFSTIRSSKGLI